MEIESRSLVPAIAFGEGTLPQSTAVDRKSGLEVSSGYNSLSTDDSTTLLRSMANGSAELPESWKQPMEICGSTVCPEFFTSGAPSLRKPSRIPRIRSKASTLAPGMACQVLQNNSGH